MIFIRLNGSRCFMRRPAVLQRFDKQCGSINDGSSSPLCFSAASPLVADRVGPKSAPLFTLDKDGLINTCAYKRCFSSMVVVRQMSFDSESNQRYEGGYDQGNANGNRYYTTTPQTQQRVPIRSSSPSQPFKVPEQLTIPEDHPSIEIGYVRSSGAGGQNVNKLNTQAQLRMHMPSATWLPLEVRGRIKQREGNRISKDDILILNSQEHRTQSQNKAAVLEKLKDICMDCYPRPKTRKLRTGPTKRQKEKRLQEKKFRSQKKENRKRVL